MAHTSAAAYRAATLARAADHLGRYAAEPNRYNLNDYAPADAARYAAFVRAGARFVRAGRLYRANRYAAALRTLGTRPARQAAHDIDDAAGSPWRYLGPAAPMGRAYDAATPVVDHFINRNTYYGPAARVAELGGISGGTCAETYDDWAGDAEAALGRFKDDAAAIAYLTEYARVARLAARVQRAIARRDDDNERGRRDYDERRARIAAAYAGGAYDAAAYRNWQPPA